MEPYSSGSRVLQGQRVYQIVGKSSIVPQMQPSVQTNTSLLNVVQNGCQYIHAPNVVHFPGVNRSVEIPNVKNISQTNYVQHVDNSDKVLLWISNPGCRNNNVNLLQGNNQRDQLQNLQLSGQGLSNNIRAKSTTLKMFPNPNLAKPPAKGLKKIPEPSQANLHTHVSQKIGSLKIHISESFLPWNITNKTVLDLEFMRHLFSISSIDIIPMDTRQNDKGIAAAVGQLLHSKILTDWLVLKCEEKEIPFLKVNNQVEIYATSNFTALLNVISQETCLPLPFIMEENNFIKYLYLNFPRTGNNNKVKKLNVPIFYIADNGKKKLPCKYPGIRLDCDFENAIESFTIHIHQSAFPVYETSLPEIRQCIIYRHVVWGFLQMWIRRVKEQYNQCFKFEDIAKNLSLCKIEASEDGKTPESDNGLIYNIGYLNCYLKFDPVALKESKASFSVDNFSTNTVCNLSIVQYYKQYFLINDMHYSDALKNTVLFLRNCNDENVAKPSSYVNILPKPTPSHILPNKNNLPQEQFKAPLNNNNKSLTKANLPASASSIRTSTVESGENDVIVVDSGQSSSKPVLAKPLLKARTVEEINSSVDSLKKTDSINNIMKGSDVSQMTHSNQKEKTRRLNYVSFVALIQKFVQNCYASSSTEISTRDESNVAEVIERRFDEAVKVALSAETIESFIEKIYLYLQFYYTTSTCQNILNKMIWRAIEAKYPHLKEHVSENIAKLLNRKLVASNSHSRDNNISLSNSQLEPQQNVSAVEDNGNSDHEDEDDITILSVTLQSEKSHSEKDTYSSGENDRGVSTVSQERDIGPGTVPSPDVSQTGIKEERSSVISANGEPNERNECSSDSPTSDCGSKNNNEHNKNWRSEKLVDESVPYRNTLTIIRVSTSPATFRISTKSKIISATESSEMENDKNESCTIPVELPTLSSNEVLDTNETPEEQEESFQTADKECPREKDYYKEYDLKPCSVVLNSNDVEMYMKGCRKRKRTETLIEESDSELEHESVRGRVKRRYYKEDPDDWDFIVERKRLRRAVSEMQYMEARTRVLQRLRKRKSLYIGYEKTRISGEELDNFFVRRDSSSTSSSHGNLREESEDEKEYENENESENEQEVEEGNDSEANESQWSKTQTEKEPAMKELRVVLVRLEDTPEYEKYRDRLLRREQWNPAIDFMNHENFPQLKKKYFEIREGKLYLKDEYHVKNGIIVRTEKENLVRPKREPESPLRETNVDTSFIKKESIFD